MRVEWDEVAHVHVLVVDKKDKETLIGKPVCDNCHGVIETPFYVCENRLWKWFCKDCQLNKEPNEPLCPFELTKDEHKHFCIKRVEEEKE